MLQAPSHQFPAQEQVIQACADLIRSRICEGDESALRRGTSNGMANMKSEQLFKGWLTKKEEDLDGGLPPDADIKMEETLSKEDQLAMKEEQGSPHLQNIHALNEETSESTKSLRSRLEDGLTEMHATDDKNVEPLASSDVKPDIKPDVKPDLKPAKSENFLILVGTYSIGKERIVKGELTFLRQHWRLTKSLQALRRQSDRKYIAPITR